MLQQDTSPPVARNARGVIAESYYDLQSLALVEAARSSLNVERGSDESMLRSVLQGGEIALYNMADLLKRAAADLDDDHLVECVTKLSWLRGFHRVLVQLSLIARRQSILATLGCSQPGQRLYCVDSPGFREYVNTLKHFDVSLKARVTAGSMQLQDVIRSDSLTSPRFAIVHLTRIANHESTIWERNLCATPVPTSESDYGTFTDSATLRRAVHEHNLCGDTYFTQFRGLHQIPEILGAEVSDLLEDAILAIRAGDPGRAVEYLTWCNMLAVAIEACLPPMVDNLATSDYHNIRENLGLTSGSHSVGLRYHLFTHLYEALCEETSSYVRVTASGDRTLHDGLTEAAADPHASMRRLLVAQVIAFRAFIFQWRDEHLHLPRNNLGGGATRSLTGSADATSVVRAMSDHARKNDPAEALLAAPADADEEGELTAYLRRQESADALLLAATGTVTQSGFPEVQKRSGFFANRSPFTKPPRRVV